MVVIVYEARYRDRAAKNTVIVLLPEGAGRGGCECREGATSIGGAGYHHCDK